MGRRTAAAVHLRLPVSRWMVRQVVEQGQWKRQKIIRHRGVIAVQPWAARMPERAEISSSWVRVPAWR